MASIEARGLRKTYRTTVALDSINLRVEEGRIVGLIGPNGAGKTTALNAILGLTPYQGELRVLGRNPWTERDQLMNDVTIEVDGLRKRFGPAVALDGMTFTVVPGQVTGFIGGEDDAFENQPMAWQTATVYFAVIELVAAVGLWLATPWGAVVWLTAAVSMAVVDVFFQQVYGQQTVIVMLEAAAIAAYLVLAIQASAR